MNTTVARLVCDQPTARRLATFFSECLDPDDTACAAFEGEDGRWQLAIHFRAVPDEAALRALLEMALDGKAAEALTIEPVASADWVAQSLAGLAPVRAGRFIVHGAHDRARVKLNDIGIEIEAALAFGTGHHGTTRGCLLALDDLAKRWRRSQIPPVSAPSRRSRWLAVAVPRKRGRTKKVLDIGTGSGVLAMAAAKAFRTPVVASDIDRVAVIAAKENVRLNHAAPAITLVHAAGAGVRAITRRGPFDLIFANILLGPLLRLAVPIRRLAAPGARVVLSGLLPAHANAVIAAYRAQGLVLERRIPLDGWMTLVLKNPR